jgi:TonB family protein
MLDQLVVSSGHRKESRKFRILFLCTATLILTGCFSVFVWSIMAMELNLTDDGLELSSMVAPVPIPVAEPQKPEPQIEQKQQQDVKSELPQRQANIARLDEFQNIPDNVSVTPNTQRARPNSPFVQGKIDSDGVPNSTDPGRGGDIGGGGGGPFSPGTGGKIDKDDVAPEMKQKPAEEKKLPVTIVHSSVINGKATNLPKPLYPAPAVAVNAQGEVSIKVLLDENGNVISAQVVSGHPLLRSSALQAARSAKFSPTILNGQKVKVDGTIIYRFSRT